MLAEPFSEVASEPTTLTSATASLELRRLRITALMPSAEEPDSSIFPLLSLKTHSSPQAALSAQLPQLAARAVQSCWGGRPFHETGEKTRSQDAEKVPGGNPTWVIIR